MAAGRREFLFGAGALGAAGLFGAALHPLAAAAATRATIPIEPSYRLLATGDMGKAGSRTLTRLSAVAARIATVGRPTDGLVVLGDNVYPDGNPALLPATLFGPYGPILDAGATLFGVLGNHDVGSGFGPAHQAALAMPAAWYDAPLGPDARLVVLDSNQLRTAPEQISWLRSTLAAITETFTVVAFHHAPYSSGFHGGYPLSQRKLAPILVKAGVDLVLCGHNHLYERLVVPGSATQWVVAGTGSVIGPLNALSPYSVTTATIGALVDLQIGPGAMQLQAIDVNGRVIDEVVITKP